MTPRRKVAVGLGALGVAALAAAAFLLWPRTTTEFTEDDAFEDFRDRGATNTTGSSVSERTTPEPGVYTYAAEGVEVVKLGPLPAESRPLPPTVTAVALDAGDGCFTWTVNLFAEHTEDTRWCTDPTLRMAGHTKHQKIGALSPTATMSCDPNQMLEEVATEGQRSTTELSCTLEMSGGPASITAALIGTATASETMTVDVGGAEVDVVPINVNYTVTGDLTGTWDETTWWTAGYLPVRIERAMELSGPAMFSETSKLQLTSMTPSS